MLALAREIQRIMKWQEIKNIVDALQIASGQTYGKKKLKALLQELIDNKTIVVQKECGEVIINSKEELQDLIDSYDQNIKIIDIV